ncbi:hypothetical protein A4K52_003672 [Salmonella enterica subsp. arizonae]|nr:hypothetical protein [Salmonella enterica subsp. arizonae]
MILKYISRFTHCLICTCKLLFLTITFSSSASVNIPKVSSTVDGLHIVAINKLPAAPQKTPSDEPVLNCDRDPPRTIEGKAVSSLGWRESISLSLAGAAATWPSAQHNRSQTAEVMIRHSGTRRNAGIIPVFCRVGQAGGASGHVAKTPLKPFYLHIGAHNLYYVKLTG